jgi:hypothetical protein
MPIVIGKLVLPICRCVMVVGCIALRRFGYKGLVESVPNPANNVFNSSVPQRINLERETVDGDELGAMTQATR